MTYRTKYKLLVRKYPLLFDYIYRYVRYRLSLQQDAEDIVGEIFAEAIESLENFNPQRGNLQQWLTGIARNRLRQYWRFKKPVVVIDEQLENLICVEMPTETIDDQMLIEKITKGLSAETKALLALRYIDGLTHEEIAQIVGKSPAAVRQWFCRLHTSLSLRYSEDKI